MNKKISFAIIGCGRIAYRHIEAIQSNSQAQLVALCDLNLERAMERNDGVGVKTYRDYRTMLAEEDIDVVNIITPSGMHAEHALDIMKRFGKHTVIEKPMCLSVSDGQQLINTAQNLGLEVFIVHQNRFNKAVQRIKSGIDEGLFGKIVLATVRIRWSRGQSYYDRDPWRGKWAFDGGVLTNQAIHHIDLLRWIVGDVESVSAISTTQLVNVEVEDSACAWLRFKNGALGVIEATTAVRPLNRDLEASISIIGENGCAIVEGASVNKLTTWTFDENNKEDYSETPPNVYGFGHNVIIDNVVETLINKARPAVKMEDAILSIQLLNALYSSIELNGKEVYLKNSPVSSRLGVITTECESIADLYRVEKVLD
jgi:predicted dehydrogenase